MSMILYAFAFASGFAALAYQVAWTRMLSMTFGSSTLAAGAVVAGFMGGMGAGAWLYHRVGDRIPSALRAYALLEVGISLSTALFTLLFLRLPETFANLANAAPWIAEQPVIRVVMAGTLLFLPSTLMGATYPALCRAMIRSADDVDRRLGWIYGLNTLGGAVGALVAGFVMIEMLGSSGTVLVANAVNATVGLGAFLLGRSAVGSAPREAREGADEPLATSLPYWVSGLLLFGSGMATLGYEIIWFRALHYLLGPGTYALSGTLTIFLVGLGLGALLFRRALRVGRPEWNLGFAQIVTAILAVFAIGGEQWILTTPGVFEHLSAFSQNAAGQHWALRLARGLGVAVFLLLPATISMGLAFPLANRLYLGSVSALTRRTGLAYLLSNLGSIVGAIGAATFVLPELGTVGGTLLFVCVNAGLGALVLYHAGDRRVRLLGMSLAVLPLALGGLLSDRLAFSPSTAHDRAGHVELVFEEESDLGTVQVLSRSGTPNARAMAIDGVVIGCTERWNEGLHSKQQLLAHLPMVLDRDIAHTLNLGVASSSTIAALGAYPWVETLDAVEINRAVIRATNEFVEAEILDDSRASVHVEDAVHYLLSTPKRYDLIINDAKQDVKSGGSSKILSEEIYRYSLGAMDECGLFAQFIPTTYREDSLRMILRTFVAVFPETEIFLDAPSSILMIGSRCPIGGRPRPTRDELEKTGIIPAVEGVYVKDVLELPALWVSSGGDLGDVIGEGPLNEWDRLRLEFWSVRFPPYTPRVLADGMRLVQPERPRDDASEWSSSTEWQTIRLVNEALIHLMSGDKQGAREIVGEARRIDSTHPLVRRFR